MPLQSNYTSYDTPRFRKLSDDQTERLHHASLQIPGPHGRPPVRAGGAGALAEERAQGRRRQPGPHPAWPGGMGAHSRRGGSICDRHGRRAMPLERNNVFSAPAPTASSSTCAPAAPPLDAAGHRGRLPHLRRAPEHGLRDVAVFLPHDIEQAPTSDRWQMRAMLSNSTKPILCVTTEFDGCVDAIRMAEAVVGGEEELRRYRSALLHQCPTAPSRYQVFAAQADVHGGKGTADHLYPGCAAGRQWAGDGGGGHGPKRGRRGGLVLAQLKREGAPIILTVGLERHVGHAQKNGDIYAAPENRVVCSSSPTSTGCRSRPGGRQRCQAA